MIEYLRLERWKAYRHLEINLEPGTTFLVARNGIGKTSVVEAAAFAVTGTVGSSPVVRAGSTDAEVEARIRLPDGTLLSVTRRIESTGRKPEIRSRATLDGSAVDDITKILEKAWKAPLSFVARIAFMYESLHSTTTEGVRDQLARAFGVADLQATLRALDSAHDELAKRTTSEDRGLREENANRDQLTSASQAAGAALVSALADRDAARNLLNEVEISERAAHEARERAERHLAWIAKRDGILRDVATITGRQVQAGGLAAEIATLDEEAQTELALFRAEVTSIRTRISIIQAAADELSHAGATCPVCRRPLDDKTHAEAAAAHDSELEALRANLNAMNEEDVAARASIARQLADQLVALGPESKEIASHVGQVETEMETARTRWEAAVEAAAMAKTDSDTAVKRLADLDASERRVEELRHLYRELALVEASRTAVESTVRRVLLERVEPLLSVVCRRWKTLFPDRPDLQLDVDGNFTRTVGGLALPFDAFSTGERAAAQLLLRLVLVEATTSTNMCWVDEPLEHLDPTSRRLVGGMLAQAGTESARRMLNLRQVFVTTYEEPLARRIADAIEDAHIVYVTATPAE